MTNTTDRRQGLIGDLGIKKSVRVATTAEITLEGLQTIDSVSLAEGDRVLVKDQTDLTKNGIYDASTGSWTRSLDFDGNGDIVNGTLVFVTSGSVNASRLFSTIVTDPITVDSSNIQFNFAIAFGDVGLVASNNLSDVPNKNTARDNLGLEIGVDIPSYFDVSKYSSGNFYIDSSVAANTYILTKTASLVNPVDGSNNYYNGMIIKFRPNYNNTGASTANVNGGGAIVLKQKDGITDISANFLETTKDYEFVYWNGIFRNTNFEIENATTSTKGISFLPKQITISNNVSDPNNDLDFTAGNAQADDGSLIFSVAALTKRLDATFVAGNNQGGLDTGTKASNTPYYCFAIYNPTSLVSDILISASFTSPTLPSGYTKKCYIGSIGYTDASSNIRPFRKQGNYTYYLNKNTPDYSITNYGTSQVFVTLLVPPVSNITSYFIFDPAQINNASDRPFFCKTFSETNASPNGTTFDILMRAGTSNSSTPFWLPTTNGQIWYRGSTATDGNSSMVITTKGWFDYNIV